jgi:xanthine dehydrogenase accessory factor
MNDFFERVAALRKEGQTFAIATVVARRAPVSAHLGDRAIILADGHMDGFVGGACAREIVRRHALEAMRTKGGRLVSIRPDAALADQSSDEHVFVPMTCVSEGAIDVYIEPSLPARAIVVAGVTPVADALARLARAMDYDVVRMMDAHEQQDIGDVAGDGGTTIVALGTPEWAVGGSDRYIAAVVATQGHYDEEALRAVLHARLPYVGLVASQKRGGIVRQSLEARGVPNVAAIRSPAGLDLGARTAPEVALSILAEIVQAQPTGRSRPVTAASASAAPAASAPTASPSGADGAGANAAYAIDPVCGMHVEIAQARHTADVDGTTYYFCCPNCRRRFLEQPQDCRQSPPPTPRGAGPGVQSPG